MGHAREIRIDPGYDPAFLPEIYIDWVYGDCCQPIVFHGDGVLVSKTAPIRPGDLVAIMARTAGERSGLTNGFVKRFVGWERTGAGALVLVTEMLNPRARREFRATDVIAVHRVLSVVSMGSSAAVEAVARLERLAMRNGHSHRSMSARGARSAGKAV